MSIAQALSDPTATWVRNVPASTPLLTTATGVLACEPGLLSPSSPVASSPQQYDRPLLASAHALDWPAETWVTTLPDSTPEADTATGTPLLTVELLPSSPVVPLPQQ